MRVHLPTWLIPDRWLAGGGLLVLLLCAAMVLNYANTRRQQEDARAVAHSHDVIDAIDIARTSVRTLQSVERRMLLGNGVPDTRRYVAAAEDAQQAVRHLRELLRDDEAPQERMGLIAQGLQEVLDDQSTVLLGRKEGGIEAAREHVLSGEGDELVDSLNGQFRSLELLERVLLEQRAASFERAYRTALVTGLITGLASILLVAGFAALLRRHLATTAADAKSLRELSEELREADRRKDRFLATLAHELRNPLAPVRTAAAILDTPQLDATRLGWCRNVIKRQVAHMAALLEDLLDVARITQGKLHLRMEPAALAAIVDVAVEAARPVIERKHHALRVSLPPHPVTIEVDSVRLSQVLTNLLTNAAKYTDAHGRIDLEAQVEGPMLRLRVRDTGIGIEPEMRDRIFHMFAQVGPQDQRAEGGLGVGLALARGVVNLHGGDLAVHSAGAGMGSEFTIELPGVVLEPGCAAETEKPGVVPGPGAQAGVRVLVADDNRDAADGLGMVLQMQGHTVQVVHSGREALDAAKSFHPDVVLLDLGMPDLDGLAVARALRESPEGRRVVLVAVTGWGRAEDRQRSIAAGFDAHLTKPVDPETLQALLSSPLAELKHARSRISELTHEE
jgi:signal transduction histidine kinase/ActR/RegA family two-component response regulator